MKYSLQEVMAGRKYSLREVMAGRKLWPAVLSGLKQPPDAPGHNQKHGAGGHYAKIEKV